MCDLETEVWPVEIRTSNDEGDDIGETVAFEDTGYCVDISAFQTTGSDGTWTEGEHRETYIGLIHKSSGPQRRVHDRASAAKIIVAEAGLEQSLASLEEPASWATFGSTIRNTGGSRPRGWR